MSISKYNQGANSERDISITIGEIHTYFTIEAVGSRNSQRERLRLALGMARNRVNASKFWEDNDSAPLKNQLTDILVEMLVGAETSYRDSLVRHREWVIEREAADEAELERRQEEAERQERELQAKLARERIGRLLGQAKALERANQIRAYVESVSSRVAELSIARADFDRWADWALREADRIDPVKNGTIAEAATERANSN